MDKQFVDIEREFNILSRKFRQKRISEREYKDKLRKLRLKDTDGKCWTIGARTGNWYYFDGKKWIESQPPSIEEGKAICIYCGYENNITTLMCEYCGGDLGEKIHVCPECNTKLDDPYEDCPTCAGETSALETIGEVKELPLASAAKVAEYKPPMELLDGAKLSRTNRQCAATSRFVLARTETGPFHRLQLLRGAKATCSDLDSGAKRIRRLLEHLLPPDAFVDYDRRGGNHQRAREIQLTYPDQQKPESA